MNEIDSYFQFPLCALAYCDTEKERLDQIISFGFVDAGFAMFDKLDAEIRELKADELDNDSDVPSDFDKANSDHVAAMIGAKEIGINVSNVEYSLCNWRELSDFRNQFQAQYGRDAEVRIRKGLVFEARDKTGISYREFAMLCAVLSCIGAKKYQVRITRQAIQCRMLGYKSPSIMRTEIAKQQDGAKPLTLRQINYTLDKLHERQFFARGRANKRQTFYSIRMTQGQLENALLESKSYSQGFHETRRQRDTELIAKVKQRKVAIKADSSIKVDNTHENSPNDVRSVSAGVSATVSTGLSTLIKTPIIETPSIKTLSIETRENTAHSLSVSKEIKKQTYKPPTLEEVREFAIGLNRKATPQLAAEWFERHGADTKWIGRDWRRPCASWILDAVAKSNRKRKPRLNKPGIGG